MKKKNSLPIKWMLGILIVLTAVVYGTHEISKGAAPYFLSKNRVLSPIIQFLENIFGIQTPNLSSGGPFQENNTLNQNQAMQTLGHPSASGGVSSSTLPGGIASNVKASQGTGQNNNENNPANNLEINADQGQENITKSDLETSAENNPENNAELNAESNSEINAEQEAGNVSETNAENNPGSNAEISSENNPGENQGGSSENNAGDNSGDTSGNDPGSASGNINPSGLPTINPIPSDNQVSQSITKQNQQNDTLASLLAARQALVIPVQQQAQASKYQIVNAQNIPAVSTNQAPADVIEKVKSNQAVISH